MKKQNMMKRQDFIRALDELGVDLSEFCDLANIKRRTFFAYSSKAEMPILYVNIIKLLRQIHEKDMYFLITFGIIATKIFFKEWQNAKFLTMARRLHYRAAN